MPKKIFLLTLYLFFSILICNAQNEQDAISAFVNNPLFKHSSIGICIKDVSTENEIASYNKEKSYTPASILKIVTTATALETLGSGYRYKTTLSKDTKDANRLMIHGYGDPTLGSKYVNDSIYNFLSEWSRQIRNVFDNPINMTIIDNYFGYEGISKKWLREDIGSYFASGSYGISVFDNTYELELNTKDKKSSPRIIKTIPAINDLSFQNILTLNNKGRDSSFIMGEPLFNTRILAGSVPAGRSAVTLKGGIPNPGNYLSDILAEKLAIDSLHVKKRETSSNLFFEQMYTTDRPVSDEEIFYVHQSPSLDEIIRVINVESNNHYAEHLIRTLGRRRNADIYSSALDEGITFIKEFWKDKGIDTDALFMHDGCGLAPSNAVSAELMCDLLLYMQNKSVNAESFLKSLPEAGSEGTVRYLLRGSRLAGKMFIKSGSMSGVTCYAGYYINGETKYAFTIMVNNYNSPRKQVVKAIEKLLLDTL